MLSKTSISSPSALAATAGEEFTGVSRVPPVILGPPFSVHPPRGAIRSSGMTPHSFRCNFRSLGASATTEGQKAERHAPFKSAKRVQVKPIDQKRCASSSYSQRTSTRTLDKQVFIRRGKVDGSLVIFLGWKSLCGVTPLSVNQQRQRFAEPERRA